MIKEISSWVKRKQLGREVVVGQRGNSWVERYEIGRELGDVQIGRYMGREVDKWVERQIYGQRGRYVGREVDRWIERQIYGQRGMRWVGRKQLGREVVDKTLTILDQNTYFTTLLSRCKIILILVQ